jgi:transcriptional regulator with XRE-family HTH domain
MTTNPDVIAGTAPMRGQRGRPPNPNKAPRPEQMEPIDLHIGHRIRGARGLRGLSRQKLAAKIGLGTQAIEKYELGLSRVLASRLFEIARVLDVPVQWFYEEFDPRRPTDTVAWEAMCRAMTAENMKLLHALERLTHGQQRTVMQMIEGLIVQNGQQQQNPSAAGAA